MLKLDPDVLTFLGYFASGAFSFLILMSGITLVWRWMMVRARYREQVSRWRDGESAEFADLGFEQAKRSDELSGRISGWIEQLVSSPKYAARLRQKLLNAGIFDPRMTGIFLTARVGLALLLPLVLAVVLQVFGENVKPSVAFGLPIAIAVLGLFLPDYYLSRRTTAYENECRRGFPDFLDLLVVATDAGMGLEQAIARVGNEIIKTYPGLGANIYLMTIELRMGRGFSDALTDLVARTNVEEIRSFATLLQQSRELGASVTAALRIYSEDMRHKRMSNAEEKAYALPAKMVIPLGVFLFPVIILIVMLPVIIRVSETMATMSK